MLSPVLLLRAPDSKNDKYNLAFTNASYNPFSVPVLETVFVNKTELKGVIRKGTEKDSERPFDGVIITSARSCEAWGHVVDNLSGSSSSSSSSFSSPPWPQTPFYVVGTSTLASLTSIHTAHPTSPYVPSPENILGAEESGNAEALARFILRRIAEEQQDESASARKRYTFLYLTGDKNRDTLSRILHDGGNEVGVEIELTEIKVYETRGSSTFGKDLENVVRGVLVDRGEEDTQQPWWIVFFAPSTTTFVWPYLQEWFNLPSPPPSRAIGSPVSPPSHSERKRILVHIAAIGPTTSTYLQESMGVEVDVVAPKPSAEALVRVITEFDGQ